MPKCRPPKNSRQRIDIDEFNEVCQESDNFIKSAESKLINVMSLTGDEKFITAFEWQNKCQRYKNIFRKFLHRSDFSSSQISRCLNLSQKLEYFALPFRFVNETGCRCASAE